MHSACSLVKKKRKSSKICQMNGTLQDPKRRPFWARLVQEDFLEMARLTPSFKDKWVQMSGEGRQAITDPWMDNPDLWIYEGEENLSLAVNSFSFRNSASPLPINVFPSFLPHEALGCWQLSHVERPCLGAHPPFSLWRWENKRPKWPPAQIQTNTKTQVGSFGTRWFRTWGGLGASLSQCFHSTTGTSNTGNPQATHMPPPLKVGNNLCTCAQTFLGPSSECRGLTLYKIQLSWRRSPSLVLHTG